MHGYYSYLTLEETYDATMTCSSLASNMHETITNTLTRLSENLSRFACGFSPSATTATAAAHHDDDHPRDVDWFRGFASLGTALLFPTNEDDDESPCPPTSSPRVSHEDQPVVDEETTLPCVAFPSQHGYMVFSLANDHMLAGVVRLRPVTGRRVVPSPYGDGTVLATDLSSFKHPSRLVDTFTGDSSPLPDMPVPLGETGPTEFEPEEPRVQGRRRAAPPTDDGFAWDMSPRGAMVARGDTVFFCGRDGGDKWVPVHRSRSASDTMTVNYRDGFFFVLEQRALVTTVIDGLTLDKVAEIPAPPRLGDDEEAVDCVHLVASTEDVILLVHRARDMYCELFSEVYRARHKEAKPEWKKVTDIGDRALFVDRLHGFSVGIGGENENAAGVRRNCVYTISATPVEDPHGRRVAVYHVEEFHVKWPEVGETMQSQLGACQVEQMWGEPYWMIPRNGGSSAGASIASTS